MAHGSTNLLLRSAPILPKVKSENGRGPNVARLGYLGRLIIEVREKVLTVKLAVCIV